MSIKYPPILTEVKDLQDMIQRIVAADNKAKQLDEENRRAAENEKKRIEEEAEEIYRKYMADAEEEAAKNDEYLEKQFDRKLQDVTAKQESALIKLRADFERDRSKWVDMIVDRVIG